MSWRSVNKMVYSYWLAPFGWGVFFIGLIAAIVLYAIYRRLSPVMYLISIATYVFTVGFVIDMFDFGKNGVLLILAISAAVFIFLGWYFSGKINRQKEEYLKKIPTKAR
jgi:hypothetical protein